MRLTNKKSGVSTSTLGLYGCTGLRTSVFGRNLQALTDMAWREPLHFLEAFVFCTVRAVCAVTHKLIDPMRFD